jgi:hypothetical protein
MAIIGNHVLPKLNHSITSSASMKKKRSSHICTTAIGLGRGQRDYTSSVALVEGVGRRGGRSDIRAIRHLYEFVVRNA